MSAPSGAAPRGGPLAPAALAGGQPEPETRGSGGAQPPDPMEGERRRLATYVVNILRGFPAWQRAMEVDAGVAEQCMDVLAAKAVSRIWPGDAPARAIEIAALERVGRSLAIHPHTTRLAAASDGSDANGVLRDLLDEAASPAARRTMCCIHLPDWMPAWSEVRPGKRMGSTAVASGLAGLAAGGPLVGAVSALVGSVLIASIGGETGSRHDMLDALFMDSAQEAQRRRGRQPTAIGADRFADQFVSRMQCDPSDLSFPELAILDVLDLRHAIRRDRACAVLAADEVVGQMRSHHATLEPLTVAHLAATLTLLDQTVLRHVYMERRYVDALIGALTAESGLTGDDPQAAARLAKITATFRVIRENTANLESFLASPMARQPWARADRHIDELVEYHLETLATGRQPTAGGFAVFQQQLYGRLQTELEQDDPLGLAMALQQARMEREQAALRAAQAAGPVALPSLPSLPPPIAQEPSAAGDAQPPDAEAEPAPRRRRVRPVAATGPEEARPPGDRTAPSKASPQVQPSQRPAAETGRPASVDPALDIPTPEVRVASDRAPRTGESGKPTHRRIADARRPAGSPVENEEPSRRLPPRQGAPSTGRRRHHDIANDPSARNALRLLAGRPGRSWAQRQEVMQRRHVQDDRNRGHEHDPNAVPIRRGRI